MFIPMIIGEIRRYLRDNSSLRVSRSLRDIAYKVIYTREGYIRKNMKEPSIQEIAEEIGLSKEEVVYALDAVQTPMSLQEPVYNDGGDALYVMDQVSDKKNREENWVEELSLEAAMERLNERERRLIRLRFFEGKTQMEVSEQIGISQAQVSRLEKNALKTMRQYLLGKQRESIEIFMTSYYDKWEENVTESNRKEQIWLWCNVTNDKVWRQL